MLSETISSLESRLGIYRGCGVEMTSEGVSMICDLLLAFAEDARELEACLVPQDARRTNADLPANVLVFRPRRQPAAGAGGRDGAA